MPKDIRMSDVTWNIRTLRNKFISRKQQKFLIVINVWITKIWKYYEERIWQKNLHNFLILRCSLQVKYTIRKTFLKYVNYSLIIILLNSMKLSTSPSWTCLNKTKKGKETKNKEIKTVLLILKTNNKSTKLSKHYRIIMFPLRKPSLTQIAAIYNEMWQFSSIEGAKYYPNKIAIIKFQ